MSRKIAKNKKTALLQPKNENLTQFWSRKIRENHAKTVII